VTISKDLGANVEVASGLTANDAVVLDPSDSLANGQEVQVKSQLSETSKQMQKKEGDQ
jgi:hypothetical protein